MHFLSPHFLNMIFGFWFVSKNMTSASDGNVIDQSYLYYTRSIIPSSIVSSLLRVTSRLCFNYFILVFRKNNSSLALPIGQKHIETLIHSGNISLLLYYHHTYKQRKRSVISSMRMESTPTQILTQCNLFLLMLFLMV